MSDLSARLRKLSGRLYRRHHSPVGTSWLPADKLALEMADEVRELECELRRYREALEYIVGSSEPGDEPQPKGMAQIAREALDE